MNNNLQNILETYNKEKENLRNKLDANKELIKRLDAQEKDFFQDCETLKEKIETRKQNIDALKEIETKIAAAYENETILHAALKVCNEMKVKAVANALRADILSNPEKWQKYPLHFQKFKSMIKDFLNGTNFYLTNSSYSSNYYLTGLYEHRANETFIFTAHNGSITSETIEELEKRNNYNIIPAADILKETKKAFTARKKILAKYENTKKEIDALRGPFSSCGAFCEVLPYANIAPENYKRF